MQPGEIIPEEADFIAALGPRTVLDAGCGTGRVAIELARRGMQVVGVDRDRRLLARARRAAPGLSWHLADLETVDLRRRFDMVLLAGNVLIFLTPGSEAAVLRNCVRHLAAGGSLVAGFHLSTGYLDLATYDRLAEVAGLSLVARYASWARRPWTPADTEVISVHTRRPSPPG